MTEEIINDYVIESGENNNKDEAIRIERGNFYWGA
jgi:hypothetical protein